MASTQAGMILRHIRGLTADLSGEVPDKALLERYTATHEEAAFAALVRRHGPLVLGVCQRVLGNAHDAEDAFQAAFLALARKADSIRKQESVGCWLYRVAFHTALRARGKAATQRKLERAADTPSPVDPLTELTGRELLTVLDEELHGLPERCRAPLVLCYLQGLTCDEAARHVGWSLRTFKRRLDQARERLRGRLLRRGLALPAALLTTGLMQSAEAAVPASLAGNTVRGVLQGSVPLSPAVSAAALAASSGLARFKLLAATVLLGCLLTVGAVALAQHTLPVEPPQSDKRSELQKRLPASVPKDQAKAGAAVQKGVCVSGRVLGSDGKPLTGAVVALVGRWHPSPKHPNHEYEVVAQGKTDGMGRFQVARRDLRPAAFYHFHVLAGAKGHGLGWEKLPMGGQKGNLELRLEPERTIRGRLLDLQGLPAGGVKGRVVYLAWKEPRRKKADQLRRLALERHQAEMAARMAAQFGSVGPLRRPDGFEFGLPKAPAGLAFWPRPFTTDAQGRFEIHGLSAGQEVHLLIEDEHFARQELQVDTGGAKQPAEVSLSLAPMQRIEGRVVYADTGKPALDVHVNVTAFRGRAGKDTATRTDKEGRFSINPYPGTTFLIYAWAPMDQPYLSVHQGLNWPKGAVKQTLEIALPRGVEVRGKVIESASGKPRAQARVFFAPRRDNDTAKRAPLLIGPSWPARSAADGSYRLVVPPGPGHLLIDADDRNLIVKTTSRDELAKGTPGGPAQFYHEVLPLNLQVKDGPKELAIKLRRGVTLQGVVLGPDGKPVRGGTVICPGELRGTMHDGVPAVPGGFASALRGVSLSDGHFELPGCDPDKTYRVFVLDAGQRTSLPVMHGQKTIELKGGPWGYAEARFGAMADISAAKVKGGKLTIRLQPCGAAEVRLREAAGKPSQVIPWVELEVVPDRGKVQGERGSLGPAGLVMKGKTPFTPDAKGRLTLRGLIPGATYRLWAFDFRAQAVVPLGSAFTVEAGKTRKLPDVVAPQAP